MYSAPVLACSTMLSPSIYFAEKKHKGQIKENVKGEVWRMKGMLTLHDCLQL